MTLAEVKWIRSWVAASNRSLSLSPIASENDSNISLGMGVMTGLKRNLEVKI